MPKGDREILKADPEDGTTPVANLLLEALIVAQLTSKERAAALFLIRRTYGWQINGNRLKSDVIPLADWAKVLSVKDNCRASRILTSMEKKGLIIRRSLGPGKSYVYSINTSIANWNNCINKQGLSQMTTLVLPKMTRVVLSQMTTPSDTILASEKEKVNKILNKEYQNIDKQQEPTLISGQSIEKVKRIVRGEIPGIPKKRITFFKKELKRQEIKV